MSSWHCSCGNYCTCDPCCSCSKPRFAMATAIVSAAQNFTPHPPSTQKAKGIAVLGGFSAANYLSPTPVFARIRVKDECPDAVWFQALLAAYNIPKVFARPCPPSPEHGFVESRDISTYEELQKIFAETKAANEDSEILFMPRIAATMNFVWTPTLLTAGPGHDGATSGKDTLSIPLVGKVPIAASTLKDALIDGVNKIPYVEAVFDGSQAGMWPTICSTQLRSGPPLGNAVLPDFVPFALTPKEVIKTNGEDLLEWAKVIRGLKGRKDVVVWHPGGSLTDHYSVHCRENGIPIVTTFEPTVGKRVKRIGDEMPPLDPIALIRGIADANEMSLHSTSLVGFSSVAMALVALHNSAVMRGPHSYWIGFGAGAVLKLGAAALEAEARHAHSCFKGMTGKPDIYKFYGAKTISFLRARVSRVSQLLHYGFGDPNSAKSFGGRKWALCGAALCPLFDAVRKVVTKPSEENASELLLALNVAINQAHNGGWWLNKFINVAAYDEVPKGNIGYTCSAAIVAMEMRKALPASKADLRVERLQRQVNTWPETTKVNHLRWRKAAVEIVPNALAITLKASTLPMPSRITIPMDMNTQKRLLSKIGKIVINPGSVKIDLEDGQDPIEVWHEEPLVAESRDVKRR